MSVLAGQRTPDERAARLLTRPGFLVALAVLLANDHYLKAHATGWLSGKLSDFAGLFVFAVFWTALAPRYRRAIHLGTAAAFLLWKSPWSEPLLAWWNAHGLWQVQRVVDYTDWAALLVLPLSYRYTRTAAGLSGVPASPVGARFARALVATVCLTAILATSYSETLHVVGWHHDSAGDSRTVESLRLTLTHLSVGHSEIRLSPTLIVRNRGTEPAVLRGADFVSRGRIRSAKLRTDSVVPYVTVAPGAEDTVLVVWTFGDSAFYTYDRGGAPSRVRLSFDIGTRAQVVEAALDTEYEAHAGRRRARTARFGAAIFLTGILVALSRRRRRATALVGLPSPPGHSGSDRTDG